MAALTAQELIDGFPTWKRAIEIADAVGVNEAAKQSGFGRGSIRRVGEQLGLELHDTKENTTND